MSGSEATPSADGGGSSRLASTLRHGWTIGVTDARRTLRASVESKAQIGAFLLIVVVFGAAAGYGGYLFGRELGLGGDLPFEWSVLRLARGAFAVLWLFLTIIVTVRTVGARGELVNEVGVLSVVPTREAVAGMLLSESAFAGSYVLPLFVAGTAGYAVATAPTALLVTAPVAAAVAVVAAVSVGYPVGLAVRHVVTRIPFVARHKGVLIVLAFVAYMALIISGALGNIVVTVFEPMQRAPVGWFADLALLGSPEVSVDAGRAVAAVGLTGVLAVVGATVGARVADRHWFADPVLGGESEQAGDDGTEVDRLRRVEDAAAGVVGRPAAAVTVLAWKRAIRAPLKLLYVAYPLLFVVGFLTEIVQTGEVPAFAAGFALVFVAWASAVVFTLNPLGDQGSALPATVLSRIDGRSFVGAHVLAGALVTVPLGTAVTTGVALLSPMSSDLVAAVAAGTPLSILVGSAAAVGIGMAFPRYDAVNVTRSTEAVVPSLLAFAAFSLYLLLTVAAGAIVYEPSFEPVVAALLTWLLPIGGTVSANAVGTGAMAALVPLGAAPFVSTWYAIRRFDRVTVA
ncbi:hypothetical protein B4589_005235 [Halolamina sp. CBA1230]|uniref:hypothetical protein n=1 Tax=Halolamina sp. CBA1230 TaxID=1853690 RepID=UPI0009A1406A|nr:hypothetical protein [Halolamina sp. CBA1230]QKY19811.1 hypothetical protein B4589_005235 [Halolamina sp. CBA1230]